MAEYTFLIRTTAKVRGMWEYHGYEDRRTGRPCKEAPVDGAIIETAARRFKIFNGNVTVDDLDDTVELTLDLPSIDAVDTIATTFNSMNLDPWAVDLVMGITEDGSEDVVWEA